MTKISELGKINGISTKSRDLFVTVNLDQGEDGTKNITREQLAAAIQQEVFDGIKVSGGYVDNVSADNVDISNSTITDTNIVDPYVTVTNKSLDLVLMPLILPSSEIFVIGDPFFLYL